jgi:hypothetical protein
MRLDQALSQISEIHAHLARGEVYRGYRPIPVAFSGIAALAAAALQPAVIGASGAKGFVLFWLLVAALSGLVCGGAIAYNYLAREDEFQRRRTRKVVGQFVPSLAAGGLITAALVARGGGWTALLPGLWSTLFGLGVFSSRPYLPRDAGWVALFYLVAGALLLAAGERALAPWGMGLTFGLGQIGAALVLYRDLERSERA